jgi:HlyD family secretion protein
MGRTIRRLVRQAGRTVPIVVWIGVLGVALWLFERQRVVGSNRASAYAVETLFTVASQSPGHLATLAVGLHRPVAAGEILASLDGRGVELRLAGARAELERLRAELKRQQLLQLQGDVERTAARTADLRRFASEREQAHLDVLSLQASQEENRIRLLGLELELTRQVELQRQGLASGSRFDDVKTGRDALHKRIAEHERMLAELRQRHEQAGVRYEQFAREASGPDPAADPLFAPYRYAIEAQQVALEEVALLRTSLALRAPAAGIVDEILVRPGEFVAAGQPVLKLVEPRPSEIVAWVDEVGHQGVHVGSKAMLERAADRSRFEAVVVRKANRMQPVPARATGDPNLIAYGLPIHLACPAEVTAVPGEAFTVRFLEEAEGFQD